MKNQQDFQSLHFAGPFPAQSAFLLYQLTSKKPYRFILFSSEGSVVFQSGAAGCPLQNVILQNPKLFLLTADVK